MNGILFCYPDNNDNGEDGVQKDKTELINTLLSIMGVTYIYIQYVDVFLSSV